MKRALLALVLVAAAAVGGLVWWRLGSEDERVRFRTAPVERGTLTATVSATGTLQPEEVIDVGAQVAGQIKAFGPDPRDSSRTIDYRSQVEDGTVLARIDDSLYRADVEQAEGQVAAAEGQVAQGHAQVEQAQANLRRAEADHEQMTARLRQYESEWTRARRLREQSSINDTELDLARANFETGRATSGVGLAAVNQAKAGIKDAEAALIRFQGLLADARGALKRAQTNLGYCTVRSPVKGVIIDRRVNIGQTVVASLNAPSLFLIAKDLRRMQIWASVNEADVGQLRHGQPVRFTVDAFAGETFTGTVAQVRLNASMTNNVVTYTVVISFDNSSGRLLPYMTANLTFEVARRTEVLHVPGSALRWQPRREQVAPAFLEEYDRLVQRKAAARGPGAAEASGVVWVEDEGELVRPVRVKTGVSDGTSVEISADELAEEALVVVGVIQPRGGEETTNPFQPRVFGGSGGSGNSGGAGGRRPQ